jgi:hypothetical protein
MEARLARPHICCCRYQQFIKFVQGDAIDIRWFCSSWCKNHFTCDDTSSNREFMPTGGFA